MRDAQTRCGILSARNSELEWIEEVTNDAFGSRIHFDLIRSLKSIPWGRRTAERRQLHRETIRLDGIPFKSGTWRGSLELVRRETCSTRTLAAERISTPRRRERNLRGAISRARRCTCLDCSSSSLYLDPGCRSGMSGYVVSRRCVYRGSRVSFISAFESVYSIYPSCGQGFVRNVRVLIRSSV